MTDNEFKYAAEKKMGPMDRHEVRATRAMAVRRAIAANTLHLALAVGVVVVVRKAILG